MKPTRHDDIDATYCDYIEIPFSVTDRGGNAVALAGATATYRVSNGEGKAHIIEKTDTDGITLNGSVATVALDTSELSCAGVYYDQLRITKDGKPLVVSAGKLKLSPLIA